MATSTSLFDDILNSIPAAKNAATSQRTAFDDVLDAIPAAKATGAADEFNKPKASGPTVLPGMPGPVPPPINRQNIQYSDYGRVPISEMGSVEGPMDTLPGIEQVAGGAKKILTAGPTPTKPGSLRQMASGGADVIHGAFQAAGPLAIPAFVANPVGTVGTVLAASGADVGTSAGLKALGVPEEYAQFGGAVAGALAGGATGREAFKFLWEKAGSPEIKIGGKFETPKEFRDMTDEELISHANKIQADPPKNFRWQTEQIVQEVARRNAEKGMGAAEPGPRDLARTPATPEDILAQMPDAQPSPERTPPVVPQQSSETAPVLPTEVVSQSAPEISNAQPSPPSSVPAESVAGAPAGAPGVPPSPPEAQPAPAVPPAQAAEPSAVVPAPVEQVPPAPPREEVVAAAKPEAVAEPAGVKGAPPEQVAPPSKQKPWQMRAQAYSDYEARTLGESPKPVSERAIAWHKGQVRDAIAAGKPVPPEVLADYPDLAKSVSPTPETAAETPKASLSVAGSAGTESARGGEGEVRHAWQMPYKELADLLNHSRDTAARHLPLLETYGDYNNAGNDFAQMIQGELRDPERYGAARVPTTELSKRHIAAIKKALAAGETVPQNVLDEYPGEFGSPEKHSYASTQVNLPDDVANKVRAVGASIPDDILTPDGRENNPHITVRFGNAEKNSSRIEKALQGQGPITAKVKTLSIFPNVDTEHGKADVLKLDIDSPDLRKLNAVVGKAVPHPGETHPEFHPHITVAFVRPGEGKKYAGRSIPGLSGQTITFNAVHFSPSEGEQTEIPLKPKTSTAVAKPSTKVVEATPSNGQFVLWGSHPDYAGGEYVKLSSGSVRSLRAEQAARVKRGFETVILPVGTPAKIAAQAKPPETKPAPPETKAPATETKPAPTETKAPVTEETPAKTETKQPITETSPRPTVEPTGNPTEVYTTSGRKVKTSFDVREAKDLTNSFDSGYPQEYQPRDTGRQGSRQRVEQRKGDMNAALMADSRLASDGVPIILKDGAVITRNHGTQALKELYQQKSPKSADYKAWVAEHAADFGLDPDKIAGMKQPVLVRAVTEAMKPADVVEFAQEANMASAARMSDAEMADMLARRMSGKLMDLFDPTEDGRINSEFVRELVKDLPVEEQSVFQDKDGKVSQTGARIIRNSIFAKAYPDPRALERMAESESPSLKNVTSGMLAAAPGLARFEEAALRGDRFPVGIGREIADAAAVMDELLRTGTPVAVWMDQGEMFGRDPVIESLVRVFSENRRSSKRIGEFLKEYTEGAEAAGSPKQETMFGPPKAPEKADVLEAAYTRVRERWKPQQDLFAQPATEAELAGSGLAPSQTPQSGQATADIEGYRPVKKPPLPNESLFGSESEDQSKADTQSYEDRLLGDQLTAQFRSGLAAKPTKLKPIQNRGLFDEEGPEQEGLSFEGYRPIPGFYSGLERAIESKMPEKASANQIDGIVKNPQNGVKPDELKWTGFGEWLAQQKGPIAKQQVVEFIRQSNVRVEEVTHGRDPVADREIEAAKQQVASAIEDAKLIGIEIEKAVRTAGAEGVLIDNHYGSPSQYRSYQRPDLFGEVARYAYGKITGVPSWADRSMYAAVRDAVPEKLVDQYDAAVRQKQDARDTLRRNEEQLQRSPAKFEQYVLPGGQNYRELLLTLPPKPHPVTWKQTEPDTWVSTGGDTLTGEHGRFEIYDLSKRGKGFKLYDSVYRHTLDFNSLADAQEAAARGRTSELTQDQQYKSPHWDEPNVLAHVRFDDRTGPSGEKVLHVAEIQSDWGQSGRKQGFSPSGDEKAALRRKYDDAKGRYQAKVDQLAAIKEEVERTNKGSREYPEVVRDMAIARDEMESARKKLNEGVPPMPFAKSWPELAMKRMLRYAAEHGYEKLTWDTGETSAARYDLSKQVKSIEWLPRREDGERQVTITPNDGNPIEFIVGPNGIVVGFQGPGSGGEFDGKHITDVVGKDIGDQIVSEKSGDLSGNGLNVGGQGMKAFYDQILPAYAARYGKKWGAKVQDVELSAGSKDRRVLDTILREDFQTNWGSATEEQRQQAIAIQDGTAKRAPVIAHGISITPAMRESVMAGQPLFYAPPKIPRIDASVRSEPFVTQAPFRFHAKMARMEPIPLEGRVSGIADAFVVNPSAMEIVGRAAGKPGDQTGPNYAGLHLAPRDAGAVARNIGALSRSMIEVGRSDIPQPLQDLEKVLRRASEAGKSVILISDHPAFEQYQDVALAEELSHAVQSQVTGKTKTHLGSGLEMFTGSPTYQKAAVVLRVRYDDLEPNGWEEATEIGVRLMRPDGYKEMGLSIPEARALAATYVQALRRAHGSQSPREIAAEVFAAFQPERGAGKPGERAIGAVARGGAGDAEGARPDLSGFKPPKGREVDERQPRNGGAEVTADKGAPKGLIARSLFGKLSSLFHGGVDPSIPEGVKPDWVREIEEMLNLPSVPPKPLPENSHQVFDTETGRIRDHGLTEKEAKKSAKSFTEMSGTEHAHRQVDTRPESAEEFPHEIKESKLAQGVEKNAIAEGLTEGFEGRPEYRTVNVKEQAQLAADLIARDLPKALRIAMGTDIPHGALLPESVFVAVENYATEHGDVDLLRQLATASTLSMEATGMGQRIRMLGERRPNSPVEAMKKVAEAREAAATKRHGPKAKEKAKAEIKESIKTANRQKGDWTKFIESIKC